MITKILSELRRFISLRSVVILTYGLSLSSLIVLFANAGGVTNDSWWHLRVGQELWQGTFSFEDRYSWSAEGAFWPAHELGFEWILYGLWLAGGETFIFAGVLNTLLIVGALLLLLPPRRLMEKYSVTSNALVPLLLFWIGFTLLSFAQIRAQAISFFMMALTVRLILSKRAQWIPLVFLLWTWLHGSVFLGVALLGLACLVIIGRWLAKPSERERFKDAVIYSLAGVLSLIATLLSPLGVGLWSYFLETLKYGDSAVQEWQPLITMAHLFVYGLLGAALLVAAAARLWRRAFTWEYVYLIAAASALFFYSLSTLRIYSNFALIIIPLVALALMSFSSSERHEHSLDSTPVRRLSVGFTIVLLLVSSLVSMQLQKQVLANGSHDPFEGAVAQALRSDLCRGALWNDYDTGSYLIWFMRDIPVSVDSRFDLYPQWVKETSGVVVAPGGSGDPTELLNETFERYNINCFVLGRSEDSEALEKRGLPIVAENLNMVVFDVRKGIPGRASQ